jgi:hypothetical protein
MEPIEQLTQKQKKRRHRAIKHCYEILLKYTSETSELKTLLENNMDNTPLGETPGKNLSLNQIDDYIKAYSQQYAEMNQATSQILKVLQYYSKLKKDKMGV